MLFWSIRAELLKLRRSCIWIAALVLPLLSAVFGTLNYLGNIAILQNAWYSLWTQHALFYCTLFAPALVGIYCAYLCRLEHLHGNWNMVMTQPIPVHTVVLSKLVVVSLLSALTQLLIGALFVLGGIVAGLTAPLPAALPLWLLRGWWSLTVQSALLLAVALVIRSFAVPVGAGLLGGFCGIAAVVKGYGVYFLFSLLPLSMCSHHPTEPMQCSGAAFVVSSCVFVLVGYCFCVYWLRMRDVKTG